MTVTIRVAVTSGRTANSPSMAKKSPNGTSPKKSTTGSIRAAMMPKVMAIDSVAPR